MGWWCPYWSRTMDTTTTYYEGSCTVITFDDRTMWTASSNASHCLQMRTVSALHFSFLGVSNPLAAFHSAVTTQHVHDRNSLTLFSLPEVCRSSRRHSLRVRNVPSASRLPAVPMPLASQHSPQLITHNSRKFCICMPRGGGGGRHAGVRVFLLACCDTTDNGFFFSRSGDP